MRNMPITNAVRGRPALGLCALLVLLLVQLSIAAHEIERASAHSEFLCSVCLTAENGKAPPTEICFAETSTGRCQPKHNNEAVPYLARTERPYIPRAPPLYFSS